MANFMCKKYVGRHVTFESGGRACSGVVVSADGASPDDTEIAVNTEDYLQGQTVCIVMRAAATREFGPCTPVRAIQAGKIVPYEVPTHWGW